MCGRYYQTESAEVIREVFGIKTPISDLVPFSPRYNIAPMQLAPIVRLNPTTLEREWVLMRWGLIPSWSKDAKSASFCINAKSETLASKPSFREAFKRRRCLVPASGFFEWKKLSPKEKQPYKISINGEKAFGFAGLWESWVNPETTTTELTFTIITCEPNELVNELHNRMPVIISKQHWDIWLSNENLDTQFLQSLLAPYSDENMYALPVSKAVGNVRNDSKDLLEEVTTLLF